MSQSLTTEVSTNDNDKIDLILSGLEQLKQDVHLAKCEIKTDIDARLHGIELRLQRQNSST